MRDKLRALTVVVLLLGLVAGCTAITGETAGQTFDDTTITAAVKAKLAGEQPSTLTRVGVETVRGTVYLTGVVDTEAMKQRATEVAWQVEGVRGVVNNLQIQTSRS